GYLMTGPFFTAGDIGKVEVLLQLSMVLRIAIALVGAAALTYLAYRVTRIYLQFHTDADGLNGPVERMAFNFHIIILPWLIGASTVTLLYLPVVALVSIIYPLSSGMVFIFPWKNAKRVVDAQALGDEATLHPAWTWYAALVVAVLFFRLVLGPGIAIPWHAAG
ncbi:MAG: hypothetical protein ACOH13_14155, partial [Flavobacteriales bacterium]